MAKVRSVLVLVIVSLLFLSSCTTIRSEYFVEGEPYLVQEKGSFGKPADPELASNQVLKGWRIAGSSELYTDWANQPEGVIRFDAEIEDYVYFYVDGDLWKTVPVEEFANPGTPSIPATEQGRAVFIGWYPEGTDSPVKDWTAPLEGVTKYEARFVDLVNYYVDGKKWASQRVDQFGYPGDPKGKDIARGYEFAGWVSEKDYFPYEDWSVLPAGVRRFDALLLRTTVMAGVNNDNDKIILNLEKDFTVLGPVTVDETYEIIDGEVRIGGKGYKDLLEAAIALYPETDQVIDIVVDYTTQVYKTAKATLDFETASYTGLAIDIK